MVQDITAKREAERLKDMTNAVTELFARKSSRREYLDAVVGLLSDWSGCHHVGIRVVNKQGQIPYESMVGYSDAFCDSENWLSVDADQCVCIRCISGKPEPQDAAAMTPAGSFYFKNIGAFVESLTEGERSRFRGVCARMGYATVAAIPVRSGTQIMGAIHMADEREGLLSLPAVSFLESLSLLIGEAIRRFAAEEELEYNYGTQAAVDSLLQLALESTPTEQLLKQALEHVQDLAWLDFEKKACAFLVEDDPELLVLKAQIGFTDEDRRRCATVPFGKCLCGTAALKGETQFADRVDYRHDVTSEAPHGHYCVPMRSGGKTLGMLTMFLKEGHRRDGRDEGFLTAMADVLASIVEHRNAEKKLVEFEELNKLKTSLLSTVSHELRTPLASIKGYSTLMLDYDKKLRWEEKRSYLETIDKSTDRLVDLIDHLLDMSRLGAGLFRLHKQPARIDQLIDEAVADAQLRAPGQRFRAEIDENLPQIALDARRIHEVMDNLLENCIRYADKGTEVVVRAGIEGDRLHVSVADQGKGIPSSELDKVFNPMYRLEKRLAQDPSGLGLGLPLCKGLVEAHGGRIWLESELGKGTTAHFLLPVYSDPDLVK